MKRRSIKSLNESLNACLIFCGISVWIMCVGAACQDPTLTPEMTRDLDAIVLTDIAPEATLDCRRASASCATGFICQLDDSGAYECLPEEVRQITDMTRDVDETFDQGLPSLQDMSADQETPRCGDGIRNQDIEECDDGNESEADGCLNSCVIARCGDGITRSVGEPEALEECDDGNTNEGDECLSSCLRPHCGDGIVNRPEEECDDGNDISEDGCLNTCLNAYCGDGITRTVGPTSALEECDDGNRDDQDDCLNTCAVARCGDGVINQRGSMNMREGCDLGIYNGTSGCSEECVESGLCDNSCETTRNGVCDDGGYQSDRNTCSYGSDCADCGPRIADTCLEYPLEGVCLNELTIAACITTSGNGRRELTYSVCRDYERCVEGEQGDAQDGTVERSARCVLREDFSCQPGSSSCLDVETLQYCDLEGTLRELACDFECTSAEGTSFCRDTESQGVSGTLSYETYGPNASLTDWAEEPSWIPSSEVLIISYTYQDNQYRVFDVTRSDAQGRYTVQVPTAPNPEDVVFFWLVKYHEGEPYVSVINPNYTEPGLYDVSELFSLEMNERSQYAGSYRFISDLIDQDGNVAISEAEGAGLFKLYDFAWHIYEFMLALTTYGSLDEVTRPHLAIWVQQGVDWSCGACFLDYIHRGVGESYVQEAILFSANQEDRMYLSNSVILHELGHWVMARFGTSPNEGGKHFFGIPTLPGQAWSEGFATFFMSLISDQSVYYSKQRGSFFWFDLKGRAYSQRGVICSDSCAQSQDGICQDGGVDSRGDQCIFGTDCSDCGARSDLLFVSPEVDGIGYPDPQDPLLQLLDENVVASTLYHLAQALVRDTGDGNTMVKRAFIFLEALQSPEVNPLNGQFLAPYGRGYVRHSWEISEEREYLNITPYYQEPAPSFPDYLDSLRCFFALLTDSGSFPQLRSAFDLEPRNLQEFEELIADRLWTYPYRVDTPAPCRLRLDQ